MNESLYSSKPLDKEASVVTSQKGCSDELTSEQERQNLVARYQRLMAIVTKYPKKSRERKQIGAEIQELAIRIRLMKTKKKAKGRDLTHYIVDVLKEKMTSFEWKIAVDEAVRRHDEDELIKIQENL